MEISFPLRPDNDGDFSLSKLEKDILRVKLCLGYSNATAYALFNPHLCDRDGKLNKAGQRECRQFFSHPNNIAYMDALKAHLSAVTKGGKVIKNDSIDDTRKDNALKSLLNQAMSLVEKGEDLDAESLKTISEIFKKVGLLKDDVEVQEAPRRYLPERCGSCLYCSFVESHVESGEIENACLRCKALKVAQEQGFVYDEKTLLEPNNEKEKDKKQNDEG